MKYPAIVSKFEGSYMVEFPGLDGCLTEGDDLPQALLNAKEALDGWLESNYDRNLTVKKPDECLKIANKMMNSKQSLALVPVSAVLTLAYQMRFSRKSDGNKSLQDLADSMKMTQQNYSKVFENPRANPTIETIEKGLSELGYILELKIVPKNDIINSEKEKKLKLKIQSYDLPVFKKKA